MSFFANLGHPTYAISLRGHHQLANNSIADYVTDIQRVIDEIGVTPILIGFPGDTKLYREYGSSRLRPTRTRSSTWTSSVYRGFGSV